jgi:hypothetical protein
VGFVVNKVTLGVLRFPLPTFIPPIAPQSAASIIWGWYNKPVVAAVSSGLNLTPLRIIIINNNKERWKLKVNLQSLIKRTKYRNKTVMIRPKRFLIIFSNITGFILGSSIPIKPY